MSLATIVKKLKEEVRSITASELKGSATPYFIVDVREVSEVESGIIPGARHISKGILETEIENHVGDFSRPILLYCAAGTRSLLAAESLRRLGYSNVTSLELGIKGWKDAGFPIDASTSSFSKSEAIRYSAQVRLKEVGETGQKMISAARVLIVGAGGLGSPTAYYLAAAGVGSIGIVDDDKVELSNLQRQILHNTDRVGLSKVDSALLTMKALNPNIKVTPYHFRLDRSNIEKVIVDYDIVVDGTDNFQTRYLINDSCLKHRKLNVHGSVFGFEGQISVFCAEEGPCYRCLYPDPPPSEFAPNCNEAGVLGVIPGLIGVWQATEVLKLILGVGDALKGRLGIFDALTSDFSSVNVKKNPGCTHCSDPSRIVYGDYQQFCSTTSEVGS